MDGMRAARWYGRGDVRVVEVPRPEPGPGELLVRVSWCGICGTDVEEFVAGPSIIPVDVANGLTGRVAPITLGHEFVGEVAALGPGVADFLVGERVAPEVVLFCGECFFCRRHEYALCVNWAAIGLHADGGLAEFAVVPAFSCARVPASLSDEEAALVEPTEVAVRAVRKSDLRLGHSVAVIGGGPIGQLIVQVARAAGAAAVYLVEPRASRRDLATSLGATATFGPGAADWQAELTERCNGVGPDVVFECAGGVETADLAVHTARKGGLIVLVGINPQRVPLSTLAVIVGEKRLVGTVQHHYDEDLPVAVQLLAEGRVQVAPLITGRVALERVVPDALRVLAEQPGEHLKIIVSPRG